MAKGVGSIFCADLVQRWRGVCLIGPGMMWTSDMMWSWDVMWSWDMTWHTVVPTTHTFDTVGFAAYGRSTLRDVEVVVDLEMVSARSVRNSH